MDRRDSFSEASFSEASLSSQRPETTRKHQQRTSGKPRGKDNIKLRHESCRRRSRSTEAEGKRRFPCQRRFERRSQLFFCWLRSKGATAVNCSVVLFRAYSFKTSYVMQSNLYDHHHIWDEKAQLVIRLFILFSFRNHLFWEMSLAVWSLLTKTSRFETLFMSNFVEGEATP